MKSSTAVVAAAAGLLVPAALAKKNAITYPDTALDLHLGDSVVVSYTTDYETPWLYIFCENGDALTEIIYYDPSTLVDASSVTFDLTYDYMPTGSCFFNLRPAQRAATDNDASVGASSPAFKYDEKEGHHEKFAAGGDDKPASKTAAASPSTTTKTTAKATASMTTVAGTATTTAEPAAPTADDENTSAATMEPTSSSVAPQTSESALPEGAGARAGVAAGAVVVAAAAALLA